MAALTVQEIITGAPLTTVPVVYYTGLANQAAQIQQLVLFNSDSAGSHLVNLWLATGNGTPVAADKLGTFTVAAGATLSVYQAIKLVVPPNATIQASSDANGVVVMKASANIVTG